ncbi:MAG: peptidoglycan-associated lipoprotein Pal [Rhodospirillaceae bacterium]|nr:peptidoglycan-associated lipoprotein Pal [Rhodospirillaceae bacterium]
MRAIAVSLIVAVFALAGCASEQTETSPTAGVVAPATTGPAAGSVEEFVQVVGDRVFFGFDRYDLSPEARATLEAQAAWLQQYPNVTVQVEGHADERGTRAYNLALGDRRATAARNYLVALGISDSRISTISYGKERPAVLGSNEAAWAQNRRAVTVILSGAPTS